MLRPTIADCFLFNYQWVTVRVHPISSSIHKFFLRVTLTSLGWYDVGKSYFFHFDSTNHCSSCCAKFLFLWAPSCELFEHRRFFEIKESDEYRTVSVWTWMPTPLLTYVVVCAATGKSTGLKWSVRLKYATKNSVTNNCSCRFHHA